MSIEDEARAELVVAAERLKKYHGDGFIRSEFRSDMNTVLDSILLVDGAPRKASHKVEVAPSARVVFRGFDTDCGAGFCRSGCSHKMWACSRCSSEGGWGSPVSDLQEMSDAHRCPDPPVTAPTESEQYQGLASAMLLLREQEFHFPADSIASAIDELKRLRSLAAEVNMWSAPVDGEDLMCLISEAENFSGEDRTQMLDLIPRLVTAVKAGFRLPVPPEKPLVHNHGPAEGRGLDCNESIVGGFLQGACMRVTEQTDPFSQSPHMASKYWAELVKARNRIAELEAAAVPVEPSAEVSS